MIPEEDLPPAWLRDFGQIEVDIARMEEFAAALEAEVQQGYGPHLQAIEVDVTAAVPAQHREFVELFGFLESHREAQVNTYDSVYLFRDATGGLAFAAKKVSQNYAGADAFAAARARDVEAALDQTVVAKAPPPGAPPEPQPGPQVPPVMPTTPPSEVL